MKRPGLRLALNLVLLCKANHSSLSKLCMVWLHLLSAGELTLLRNYVLWVSLLVGWIKMSSCACVKISLVTTTFAHMLTTSPLWLKSLSDGWVRYNLGNDYFTDSPGNKYISSSTYICEAICKVESKYGELTPEPTPAAPDDHPEDNLSPLCSVDETKIFKVYLAQHSGLCC